MVGSIDDNVLRAISTRLSNIDEAMTSVVAIQRQNAEQIEVNTQQIAALTEGLTRLENSMNSGFERLEDVVSRGFERLERNLSQQYEITRMQGATVDRLIALLEQRS